MARSLYRWRANRAGAALLCGEPFLWLAYFHWAADVRVDEQNNCRPSDRFPQRRQLAGATRDLRTALDGGRSETGAHRTARLFLERRCALPGETLGRGLQRISKGAQPRGGGGRAAGFIFAPTRAARAPPGRAAVIRPRVQKERIPGCTPGVDRAIAPVAGSWSALGRTHRPLDDPGAR